MILYRPWGSMKLVCNFLLTVSIDRAVLLYLRGTSIVLQLLLELLLAKDDRPLID